ncbi:hypothetical protein DEO72_LG7g2951 [Vigna unguiculata]|uniref:Uncharacterized protein n=1 Tax=Vigna unguiculata TaxID=3917 RepID=A0A4D6MM10_VIGUN|nr:hypothetical protein DEO72_LG7g2951 [Vigna unguiculata]
MMQSNDTCNAAANSSHKKRVKVPKRGPGVAELEKMMRGQNGIHTTDKRISELSDGNQYDSTHFSSKHLYSESNPFWSYFGTVFKTNHESSPSPLKKMVSMTQSHSSTVESDLIPSFSYYNRPLRSSINDSNQECYRDVPAFATAEVPSPPPLHLFPVQPCQVIEVRLSGLRFSGRDVIPWPLLVGVHGGAPSV